VKAGNVDTAGGGAPYKSVLLDGGATVGASVGMLMTGDPVNSGKPVNDATIDEVVFADGAMTAGVPETSTTGLSVKTGKSVREAEMLGPIEVGLVNVGKASVSFEGRPVPVPEAPGGRIPPPTSVTVL
jgi:hypothetical protein